MAATRINQKITLDKIMGTIFFKHCFLFEHNVSRKPQHNITVYDESILSSRFKIPGGTIQAFTGSFSGWGLNWYCGLDSIAR